MSSVIKKPVTAVMVTYHSATTVSAALDAMKRCHDAGLAECVVVDNGSTDDTAELLQPHASWARVILTGKNNGFGRGCNVGLEHADTPYTLFINPDAMIEPEALRTLVDHLEQHPQVGIVGPATITGDGTGPQPYQRTGPRQTPLSIVMAAMPVLWEKTAKRYVPIIPGSEPFRTGWVCGAEFLTRTSLMKQLKGFDPRFFLYWEETDVCRRADDLGFQTWAVGRATASHIGGVSSADDDTRVDGCIARYYYQSRLYYMSKHHGWLPAVAAELGELLLLGALTSVDLLRGRGTSRIRARMNGPLLTLPDPV